MWDNLAYLSGEEKVDVGLGMKFEAVVRKRRMVRHFRPDAIPMETVNRIMSLALHAPSAGFSQGSAYVVVTRPELRKKVGEIMGEKEHYGRFFHNFISEAPVIIVPCVSEKIYHDRYREPDKLQQDGTEIEWPVPFWHFDIGCGCMIILLAAVNEGLAAAFAGTHRADDLRRLLGIPGHFQPVGAIPIGHPDKDRPSPSLKRGRRPYSEVVHHESWNSEQP